MGPIKKAFRLIFGHGATNIPEVSAHMVKEFLQVVAHSHYLTGRQDDIISVYGNVNSGEDESSEDNLKEELLRC